MGKIEYNYCTLFNYNYLSRGLTLYDSLLRVHDDFNLFIYAFDEKTRVFLLNLNLKHCKIIGLEEFEDKELLEVKKGRSFTEYCWTCTSSVIKYSIEKFNLPSCTYLDADLYFYKSPVDIFAELEPYSIGLTPHNYSKEYDREKVSGRYCVQFVFFRNDEEGMKALKWWREKCLEWCFSRIEKDRFGDQKYLDFFSSNFKGVHDILNEGSGIAPWNILEYSFKSENDGIRITNSNNIESDIIFYHFHKIVIDFEKKIVHLSKYYYNKDVLYTIYNPYLKRLLNWEKTITGLDYYIEDFRIKTPKKAEIKTFMIIRKITNNLIFRKIYNLFIK